MRAIGLDLPHEQIGEQGVVSWYMASDAKTVPIGPSYQDYQFEHCLQLVREPLGAIASISALSDQAWQYISEHIPCQIDEPILLRSAKYWYYWNKMAEQKAQCTIKVEDEEQIIKTIEQQLSINIDYSVIERVPKNVNTRQSGRLFHMLEELLIKLKLYRALPFIRTLFNQKAPTPKVTWQQLNKLDPQLTANIKTLAKEYGYDC